MGHTNMRKGMQSLALLVQQGLGRDPHGGGLYSADAPDCYARSSRITGAACRSTLNSWSAPLHLAVGEVSTVALSRSQLEQIPINTHRIRQQQSSWRTQQA